MMREQNPGREQAAFHIVARRTSQAGTQVPPATWEAQRQTFAARRWKLFERLGLILGVAGISITSLIAGIGRIHEQMQAVESLQEKIAAYEKRVEELEEINHRQDNEIQYLKGRIEQSQAQASPVPPANPASARETISRASNSPTSASSADASSADASSAPASPPLREETRAPLHVIDKLRITISYAYHKARMTNPNLAGRLSVTCMTDGMGNLTPSEVVALDPELAALALDVRDKVRRWNFPETVTGLEEGGYRQIYFLSPSSF